MKTKLAKLLPKLKDVKIGPPCLKCGEPIAVKPRWQTNGWLHRGKCELATLKAGLYMTLGGIAAPVGLQYGPTKKGNRAPLVPVQLPKVSQ
jgi:hypothetical protein